MELTKDEVAVLVEARCRGLADSIRETGSWHFREESIDRLIELLHKLKEDASGTTP